MVFNIRMLKVLLLHWKANKLIRLIVFLKITEQPVKCILHNNPKCDK